MSKIAKKPIIIPEGVEVVPKDSYFEVKGKGGTLQVIRLPFVSAEIKDKQILLKATALHKQGRANWGTQASLIKNAIQGVQEGFTKILELEGIGFRAALEGNKLVLTVGYTNPIKFESPAGIKITLEKNQIKIFGADKAVVGRVAAQIRKFKEPEPYKGTGIRYKGEIIRRKAGKKAAGATGAGAS